MKEQATRMGNQQTFHRQLHRVSGPFLWTCAGIALYILITRLVFGRCCPFQIFCGLPCPGCGLLHAGVELLMLRFSSAWQINPCIYLWTALIVLYAVHFVTGRLSGKVLFGLMTVICLVTIVVYFVRMLTVFPSYPMDFYPDNLLHLFSRL